MPPKYLNAVCSAHPSTSPNPPKLFKASWMSVSHGCRVSEPLSWNLQRGAYWTAATWHFRQGQHIRDSVAMVWKTVWDYAELDQGCGLGHRVLAYCAQVLAPSSALCKRWGHTSFIPVLSKWRQTDQELTAVWDHPSKKKSQPNKAKPK